MKQKYILLSFTGYKVVNRRLRKAETADIVLQLKAKCDIHLSRCPAKRFHLLSNLQWTERVAKEIHDETEAESGGQ